MEQKPFQGREERFRDGREGDRFQDRCDKGPGHDGRGRHEYQDYNDRDPRQNWQGNRDLDQRDFWGRKHTDDAQDVRDV